MKALSEALAFELGNRGVRRELARLHCSLMERAGRTGARQIQEFHRS